MKIKKIGVQPTGQYGNQPMGMKHRSSIRKEDKTKVREYFAYVFARASRRHILAWIYARVCK
jgi:hypothetical protein